jgi:hypothetical protein
MCEIEANRVDMKLTYNYTYELKLTKNGFSICLWLDEKPFWYRRIGMWILGFRLKKV